MTAIVFLLALWSDPAIAAAPSAGVETSDGLSIDEAVAMALERSFQLQRSERSERIAGERTRSVRAAQGPRIELLIGADEAQRYYDFRGRYDYSSATPQFSAAVGAYADYDFDISGVRKRSLDQARLSEETSSVDVEQVALAVRVDTRQSYLQALRAQQQVEVDQRSVELLDALVVAARLRQPAVVDFLVSERATAALVLDQSRQGAELALSTLRRQLRLETDQPVTLTSVLSDAVAVPSADQLGSLAAGHRSDIRQSEIRLRQAKLTQVGATDYRRPALRVSAFASHSLTGDRLVPRWSDLGRAQSAGVALNFYLPLWTYDGGELDAARNIAALQAEQAAADAEEAKERARDEIAAELIGLRRARARLDQAPDPAAARQALAGAEEQLLAAAPKDAPGLLAQVSNARQNWRSSVLLKADALAAFYGEYFRLQRSVGSDDF